LKVLKYWLDLSLLHILTKYFNPFISALGNNIGVTQVDIINIIFIALGGAASALVVVGFLGQKLVSFWFSRELEAYKGCVVRENNETLETLKTDLQLLLRAEERTVNLELTMDKYRGPLVHSAYDLQSRIFNLVKQNVVDLYFFEGLGDGTEKEYFLKNTMYVMAQYFAWTEIIRKEIQFIEFSDINTSQKLSSLQDEIYSILQFTTQDDSLNIWAGEQRGIGELMLQEKDSCYTCIGYSQFLKLVKQGEEPLLSQLETKIECYLNSRDRSSVRLIKLQNALIDLLEFLDPDYVRFPKGKRTKIT
tara:strand:- start:65 stop:979 length:915 start_codon:yes stop_codon:yes gene_type:complete